MSLANIVHPLLRELNFHCTPAAINYSLDFINKLTSIRVSPDFLPKFLRIPYLGLYHLAHLFLTILKAEADRIEAPVAQLQI